MYSPSHTLQKGVSATYILQHHYIIKPHLPSSGRLGPTHSLGAPTIPRKSILCIMHIVPLHVYNKTTLYRDTTTKLLYNTTSTRVEIRLPRANPSRCAPTTPRTYILSLYIYGLTFLWRESFLKKPDLIHLQIKPLPGSVIRSPRATPSRGAPSNPSHINYSVYCRLALPQIFCRHPLFMFLLGLGGVLRLCSFSFFIKKLDNNRSDTDLGNTQSAPRGGERAFWVWVHWPPSDILRFQSTHPGLRVNPNPLLIRKAN